jgi:hypothetical protein
MEKNEMTTSTYSKYDHTAVLVSHPDKPDGWDGAFDIVLHTGKHVWVVGSYAHQGHADLIQVGIGGPTSSAFDEDGNCILAVPVEWCRFLTPEEADQYELSSAAESHACYG